MTLRYAGCGNCGAAPSGANWRSRGAPVADGCRQRRPSPPKYYRTDGQPSGRATLAVKPEPGGASGADWDEQDPDPNRAFRGRIWLPATSSTRFSDVHV